MSTMNLASTDDDLTRLVLREFPYPMAVHYERMLREDDWQKKVFASFKLFEFTLRTLTLALLSDYLSDIEAVNDAKLTSDIFTQLSIKEASLGIWCDWFMRILYSFKGKPEKLILSELYDLYWDTTSLVPRPKAAFQKRYVRFVEIRNQITHFKYQPQTEQAWAAVFSELNEIIRIILGDLAFLQNYDVVRIMRRVGQSNYEYELYTGLQVKIPEEPLTSPESLVPGWFYLCKQTGATLQFHPLMIAWEKSIESEDDGTRRDTALLERYSQKPKQLTYLLPVAGISVTMTDLTLIDQFIERVFRSIDRVTKQEHDAKRLTWQRLQELAYSISLRRMSGVVGKFNSDLYLQRDSVMSAFEKFLVSDEVCFVVTGKSGVGKSNFLLSLLAEYGPTHPDVCFIIYDGTRIETGLSLNELVAVDLGLSQNVPAEPAGLAVAQPWLNLAEIDGIDKKTVVLCIDAINENSDPKALLRQLDNVVERCDPKWKWLKIVVTAKSEAWRVIRRGVQLAEARYYRQLSGDQVGVELEQFSHSEVIEPFTQDELESAYEKYKRFFDLQTPFGALTAASKKVLRDPLTMRLIAKRNCHHEITQPIQTDDIVGEYVQHLQTSGQLQREDVHFLEYELMRLMLAKGKYSNIVSDNEIAEATTSDGRRLHELIWARDLLSSGQHVNQSFLNLLFAEILVEHEHADRYEIGFKFERFYDYFAARQLARLSKSDGLSLSHLQEFALQLKTSPFLWGALALLLIKQLDVGRGDLVGGLAYTTEPSIQKLLVETLVDYGSRSDQTRTVVQAIVEPISAGVLPEPMNGQSVSPACIAGAKSVAVQVAAYLSIPGPLVYAADDNDATVRTIMVREFAHLWRRDIAAGEQVLSGLTDRLARRIGPIPIPNRRVIESALAACVMTFTLNYENPPAVEPLRRFAQEAFDRLLPVRLDSWAGPAFRRLMYQPLLGAIMGLIDRTGRERPRQIPGNLEEIAVFFSRPAQERTMMLEVVRLFYRESGPILEHRATLLRSAEINDGDINWAVVHLLTGRGNVEPVETACVIKELHEYQLTREKPSYQAMFLLGGFGHYLQRMNPETPECQSLFAEWEGLVKRYTVRTRSRVHYLREYISELITTYVRVSYRLFRRVDLDFVHQALQEARDTHDWELLETYMRGLASLSGEYPHLLLEVLKPLLQDGQTEVVKSVSYVLARIKAVHPDTLEDLLGHYSLSQNLRTYLTIQPVEEPMGDVLAFSVTDWLLDAVTSDTLRDSMALLLGQMPHYGSSKQWFSMLGAFIINLVFQGPVFRVKMWPVDVGHKVLKNPFE